MQGEAAQERSELLDGIKLEILLRVLEGSEALPEQMEVTPELTALRDTARRLRAASQSAALPAGHQVVRRVLQVAARPGEQQAAPPRGAWRWARLWLSTAMAAAVVGAFGLGAGALDAFVLPSSPAYGLRLTIDRARDAFTAGRHESGPRIGTSKLGHGAAAGNSPAGPGAPHASQ